MRHIVGQVNDGERRRLGRRHGAQVLAVLVRRGARRAGPLAGPALLIDNTKIIYIETYIILFRFTLYLAVPNRTFLSFYIVLTLKSIINWNE